MDSLRQYNVRLPEELIQTLQDVAKETGRDRAELVRDALKRYFDGELWREETTKSSRSLPLSAKVEDLEKRVRKLEIAQPAIQAIQPTAKTAMRDIQHGAKADIQSARNVVHPVVVGPVGRDYESIANQILDEYGELSMAVLRSMDLTRFGTTANPKNFWDKLRDTLKAMEAHGELVAIQGPNRAITYRRPMISEGEKSTGG